MGSGSFKMIPEKKKKNTQIAGNPNSFSMPWDPYLEVWDWYGSSNLESLGMVFRTVQTSYAHKLAKTFYFLWSVGVVFPFKSWCRLKFSQLDSAKNPSLSRYPSDYSKCLWKMFKRRYRSVYLGDKIHCDIETKTGPSLHKVEKTIREGSQRWPDMAFTWMYSIYNKYIYIQYIYIHIHTKI